ncbi:MAG: hypothetical protein V1811_01815 [Candidatus Micrarchaeota archaeon]
MTWTLFEAEKMQVVFQELRKKGVNARLRFTNKGISLSLEAKLPFPRVVEELGKAGAQIEEKGTVVKAFLDGVQITIENRTAVFLSEKTLSLDERNRVVALALEIAQVKNTGSFGQESVSATQGETK